jgi:hypothetical protein
VALPFAAERALTAARASPIAVITAVTAPAIVAPLARISGLPCSSRPDASSLDGHILGQEGGR